MLIIPFSQTMVAFLRYPFLRRSPHTYDNLKAILESESVAGLCRVGHLPDDRNHHQFIRFTHRSGQGNNGT